MVGLRRYLLVIPIAAIVLAVVRSDAAMAAQNCPGVSAFGSVTLELPTLPKRGTYTVWTRINVPPSTAGGYLLEINGNDCLEIVPETSSTDATWAWTATIKGGVGNPYEFTYTEDNYVRLIGTHGGVKIDRILLVADNCIPTGLGENCSQMNAPVSLASVTDIPPPEYPVSGQVILSPRLDEPGIVNVRYGVDGKIVQEGTSRYLDTTLVSNGRHSVQILVTKADKSITNLNTVIDVDNDETLLSPVSRWIRYNQQTVVLTATIVGSLVAMGILLRVARHYYKKHRELEYHGF